MAWSLVCKKSLPPNQQRQLTSCNLTSLKDRHKLNIRTTNSAISSRTFCTISK